MKEIKLIDMAEVIRSKNAGPCELTLDVIFKDEKDYLSIKEQNFFSKELIAGIYNVSEKMILKISYFDPAFAVKVTMIRPCVSGDPGDADIYGAQQHAPLLEIKIPMNLK